MAIDQDGYLYICDFMNDRVRRFGTP